MRNYIILGVDPGIANTGISIVRGDTGYRITDHLHIETPADDSLGKRLDTIYTEINSFLSRAGNELVTGIAIERAFHNKNVSSNNTTQQVIGLLHLIGHQRGLPVLEVTPQQVKSACGLGGRAKKEDILQIATGLFKVEFKKKDNHLIDAAFAAICGILQFRKLPKGEPPC